MKTFFSVTLLLIQVSLYGQHFAVFAGANRNIFHDYADAQGHYQSTYISDYGYTAGINTGRISIHSLPLLFSLQFDHYSGTFQASDGGLGGGYATTADIHKSVLSLGIYMLNFRAKNRLDLNFGVDVSARIQDGFNGTHYFWMGGSPPVSELSDLQEKYNRFNAAMSVGLRSRIAYDVPLGRSLVLSPQFQYYFGLTPEFHEFPTKTRSMRFYLCLGIKKKLAA
jgi:hypothetical protein